MIIEVVKIGEPSYIYCYGKIYHINYVIKN